jgi:hypothetical protein
VSPSVLDAYQGPVRDEYARRMGMWRQLRRAGGPLGVRPDVLRELRIYGAAQGIWIDKSAATNSVSPDGAGVTVALMHSGKVLPDDLTDDGLIHRYPHTGRPRGYDLTEVRATKNAGFLGLPVFVITVAGARGALRDVRIGWIQDWSDSIAAFLVAFGGIGRPIPCVGEEPGRLFGRAAAAGELETGARATASPKVSVARFRFDTFRRHGYQCAACGITAAELLEPVRVAGGGPADGIVLCASHSKAYRAGLLTIDDAGRVVVRDGVSARALGVTRAATPPQHRR